MAIKLIVEISEELQQQANAIATFQGRSLADVVRSALETYIDVEQTSPSEPSRLMETDPIFQMAGKFSGSSEDVSESTTFPFGAPKTL